MKNCYDVIIIGAGPAGLACSIVLAQNGKKCLILERKEETTGKVCGDGVTGRCIEALNHIGIDTSNLLEAGAKRILYNITFYDYKICKSRYTEEDCGKGIPVGVSRDTFDKLLCERAKQVGVDILFNTYVRKTEKKSGYVILNDEFVAKTYVNASGVIGAIRRGKVDLPVGISSRMVGKGHIKDECFYFFRHIVYGDGYAWIFPVAKNIWNVGCWSHTYNKNINALYLEFEKLVKKDFIEFEYYDRKPQGALLGIGTDMEVPEEYIGDAALLSDKYSGEGISFAIESGINKALVIHGKAQIRFPDKIDVGMSKLGMKSFDYREKKYEDMSAKPMCEVDMKECVIFSDTFDDIFLFEKYYNDVQCVEISGGGK